MSWVEAYSQLLLPMPFASFVFTDQSNVNLLCRQESAWSFVSLAVVDGEKTSARGTVRCCTWWLSTTACKCLGVNNEYNLQEDSSTSSSESLLLASHSELSSGLPSSSMTAVKDEFPVGHWALPVQLFWKAKALFESLKYNKRVMIEM